MKKAFIALSAFALPALALAQGVRDAGTLFNKVNGILNAIIPFVISLAVVVFIIGIFRYIIAGDEESKKGAKSLILYGIIGIFVMISVYGLVNILVNTLGLEKQLDTTRIPKVLDYGSIPGN